MPATPGDAGQVKRLNWVLLPPQNSQALRWDPSSAAPSSGFPGVCCHIPGHRPTPRQETGQGSGEARTATEVAKDVVALLREGDLVDSVADETGFQQVAGILAGLSTVGEAFHIVVQPVHYIRAWGQGCHLIGRPT